VDVEPLQLSEQVLTVSMKWCTLLQLFSLAKITFLQCMEMGGRHYLGFNVQL
jgi:hypothetical protein